MQALTFKVFNDSRKLSEHFYNVPGICEDASDCSQNFEEECSTANPIFLQLYLRIW